MMLDGVSVPDMISGRAEARRQGGTDNAFCLHCILVLVLIQLFADGRNDGTSMTLLGRCHACATANVRVKRA